MTNSIALGLGLLILGLIGLDLYAESGALLFLGRKFVDLIQYMAFWR